MFPRATKLRRRLGVAVVGLGLTATATTGVQVATVMSASAHTGDLKVTATCNQQTGQYDLTAKLTTSNVPNGVTGSSKWRIGTSSFQGTPTSDTGMDKGPVTSVGNTTVTLGSWSLPGTTTGLGPWVYAYTKWSNGNKIGSDGQLLTRLNGDCKVSTKTIEAKALCDHEINANEWHFVITQVKDEASAPKSITVMWENGQTATLPLDKFVGGVAHYASTQNLGSNVTKATMSIYNGWSGQFNLSHGPSCDKTVKVPVPAKPSYQDPCGPGNATWVVPADTASLDWTLESDGDLVVVTKSGYLFEDVTSSKNFGKAPDSGVKCTVSVPPAPSQNDPCGPNNATWNKPADTADYAWALRSDGHLVVTVKGDKMFPDGSTSKDYGLPTDSNEPCKVPVPAKPGMNDPCGPNNATWVKPADTASVAWTLESDGDLVASTKLGYIFQDGTSSKNFGKAVDSNTPCPDQEIPVPAMPQQTDLCGPNNASWIVPADTASLDWTLRPDGHLVAAIKQGYVFKDGSKSKDYGLPTDSNEPCKIPVPAQPTQSDPCGLGNASWNVPADTADVDWNLSDGVLTATALGGQVFDNGQTVINYGVAKDSNTPCPDQEIPVPATPQQTDPCGPNNASWVVPADTESVDWTLNPGGSLTAAAKLGYVFTDGSKVKNFGTPKDSNRPCAVPPTKVRGAVHKIDKCESYNFYFVKKVKGLHYVVKGKTVREGIWRRTKAKTLRVRVVADNAHYTVTGKKRFVVKFPNTRHCGPPTVTPPAGA